MKYFSELLMNCLIILTKTELLSIFGENHFIKDIKNDETA